MAQQLQAVGQTEAMATVNLSVTLTRVDAQALQVTPAMEAGIADHVWSIEEIVGVLE